MVIMYLLSVCEPGEIAGAVGGSTAVRAHQLNAEGASPLTPEDWDIFMWLSPKQKQAMRPQKLLKTLKTAVAELGAGYTFAEYDNSSSFSMHNSQGVPVLDVRFDTTSAKNMRHVESQIQTSIIDGQHMPIYSAAYLLKSYRTNTRAKCDSAKIEILERLLSTSSGESRSETRSEPRSEPRSSTLFSFADEEEATGGDSFSPAKRTLFF